MGRRIALLAIVAVGALALTCGDSPTQQETATYTFADFVHFDTSEYILVKNLDPISGFQPEMVLYWEQSFGEPFTDVNGNGEYEAGIDSFTKCLCESNQDLNRNGQYDGPNDPWDPFIPFDDINGDGICQQYTVTKPYKPGLPYGDINRNGVYDSVLEYWYQVTKCSSIVHEDNSVTYSYYEQDSFFVFVSDSNIIYTMPFALHEIPGLAIVEKFYLTDSGLVFNTSNHLVHVLDTGVILPLENVEVVVTQTTPGLEPLIFEKSILYRQRLEVGDRHYNNLLLVRFDHVTDDSLGGTGNPLVNYLNFYFSREKGLVAFLYRIQYWHGFRYFDERLDSIPLLMKR